MLLRKLLVVVAPALLCLLTCVLFRWLDALAAAGFWQYLLKGLLLGACVALVLPAAGISTVHNGLVGWLFAAAGLLAVILLLQYLQTAGVLAGEWWDAIMTVNGQVVLAESAFTGFTLVTAALRLRRRKG